MKKIIILAVLSLSLAACKKSTHNTASYIKATINGVDYNFNKFTLNSFVKDTTYAGYDGELLQVIAAVDSGANSTSINFSLADYTGIKNQVYSSIENNDNDLFVIFSPKESDMPYQIAGVDHPVILKVTSATTSVIQGTFSGNVYYDGDDAAAVKVITNGKFYINLNQ